ARMQCVDELCRADQLCLPNSFLSMSAMGPEVGTFAWGAEVRAWRMWLWVLGFCAEGAGSGLAGLGTARASLFMRPEASPLASMETLSDRVASSGASHSFSALWKLDST